MTAPVKSRARRELSIVALAFLTFSAYGASIYTYGVLIDALVADLGASEFVFLSAFGASQILAGAGSIVAGRILDRRGSTPVYLMGIVGSLVLLSAAAAPATSGFVALYVTGAGIVGAAGFYHISQTAASRLSPGDETGAITRLTVYAAFSAPFFIPLAGRLVARSGWRPALATPALITLFAFLLAMSVSRTAATATERHLRIERSMFRGRAGRFVAGVVLAGATIQMLSVYQVPIMTGVGLTLAMATTLAGARGIAQFAGRVPLTWVVRRTGAARALRGALVLLSAGTVALGFGRVVWTAAIAIVVIGIAIGAESPLIGIRGREVFDERLLGSALGVVTLGIFLAGAVGPVVAGWAVSLTGSRSAAAVTGGVLALAAAMAVGSDRRTESGT